MKRLQEIQLRVSNKGVSKLKYDDICNEPINTMVPMKLYLINFEKPKIDKFKRKEYPK